MMCVNMVKHLGKELRGMQEKMPHFSQNHIIDGKNIRHVCYKYSVMQRLCHSDLVLSDNFYHVR